MTLAFGKLLCSSRRTLPAAVSQSLVLCSASSSSTFRGLTGVSGGARVGAFLFSDRQRPVTVQSASVHHHRERHNLLRYIGVIRSNTRKPNRHWNPIYRKERGRKFIRPQLPDMDLARKKENVTFEELRTMMKREGIPPGNRNYNERPMLISSTSEVFEPYLVPEGDGKFSVPSSLSSGGKQMVQKALLKDTRARRKIRAKLGEEWDEKEFAEESVGIYVDAHEALQNRDSDKLHDLVTEKAFPEMWKEVNLRSVKWKFIENIEKPKVVRMRVSAQVSKDNEYAQVTVRIHSKQILAIFDQFGRLMVGSETVEVPVVEHVVFENHIVNKYGSWRLHAKLHPDQPKPSQLHKTFVVKELEEKYDVPDQVDKWIDTDEDEKESERSNQPALA